METPWKPTPAQIAAASGRHLPDLLADDLRVLFVGINPSLYSAAVGHHFARPGNRFWPTLHAAGFTARRLSPFEDGLLPGLGYGLTNLVARAMAAADELADDEVRAGAGILAEKVHRHRPRFVAVLGVGAYRTAFARPGAAVGLQQEKIAEAAVWVLPNPSGLNAHYQIADLARLFAELRRAAGGEDHA